MENIIIIDSFLGFRFILFTYEHNINIIISIFHVNNQKAIIISISTNK